jgi:hypothetical protein
MVGMIAAQAALPGIVIWKMNDQETCQEAKYTPPCPTHRSIQVTSDGIIRGYLLGKLWI